MATGVIKIIHIEEALKIKVHITQKEGCFFYASIGEKVFNPTEVKETHNIQAQGLQEEIMCLSATTDRQKYWGILCYTTLAKLSFSLLVQVVMDNLLKTKFFMIWYSKYVCYIFSAVVLYGCCNMKFSSNMQEKKTQKTNNYGF